MPHTSASQLTPDSRLRIIFAGTPDFAAIHLSQLLSTRHTIVAVYTQPDRPAGRGKKLHASPVKQVALDAGLPVLQPVSLKGEDEQKILAEHNADIMIVVAYGLLLPQAILEAPRFGCFNVHGSILPRWRGAAPIQRAIEAGDTETGITIMQMNAGLDTGDMLYKVTCPITALETAGTLHDKLAELGPPALTETLDLLCQNKLTPEPQVDSQANYAHKLSKQEGTIHWQATTHTILQKVRAFNPFPVCHTTLRGERVRIFEATQSSQAHNAAPGTIISHAEHQVHIATGDGAIAASLLQLPGKKAMPARDLLNGVADKLALGICFE